ncbi:MAG: SAM-dependent chlorinase/fluorinase [Anaerolineales bacterium]|nr:SAM-dependent chlorinase/fluorinase [Anaerolineales bacterium]MBS3753769.1 SAM-dependent chlorinase/fluorinase [Anaerolineales bacterium]
MPHPPIVILTDFGEADPFVAIMKGVIAQISPRAQQIDLTHQVDPGDIQRGALLLWQAYSHFPEASVFLTVIDPGVGTDRKAICLEAHDRIFIGPDNGIFSYLTSPESKAWQLTNTRYQYHAQSATFHGRDIFAPAAAHAAAGIKGPEFGSQVSDLVQLPRPTLKQQGEFLVGEVLTHDRFGNVLTSLGRFNKTSSGILKFNAWLGSIPHFEIAASDLQVILPGGEKLPLINTFADVKKNSCAAVVGSTGLIEIVSNQASAAEILGLKRGERLRIRLANKGSSFQSP